MGETSSAARRSSRWFLPSVLLGVYLFLKLQGLFYAHGVADLERQLDELRPALATKAMVEQLEILKASYAEGAEKIRQIDVNGAALLKQLSELPPPLTLRRVHLRPDGEFLMEGWMAPGGADPDPVLAGWAQTLQVFQPKIRIVDLKPAAEDPAKWEFRLEGSG